jgi:hypothetical protein
MIYHFLRPPNPYVLYSSPKVFGFPTAITQSHDTITLMYSAEIKKSVVQRIPYTPGTAIVAVTPDLCSFAPFFADNPDIDQFKLSHYDGGFILGTELQSFFLDVSVQAPIIVGVLPVPNAQVFGGSWVVSGGKAYQLEPVYDALCDTTDFKVMGALMRRSEGLHAALELVSRALAKVTTVAQMDDLVWKVGQFATRPIAQIRFARLLLHSGIPNTHLILRGIVTYSQIMNQRLTGPACAALCEMLFHRECRFTLPGLLSTWGWKLNREVLRAIAKGNDSVFDLDPGFVSDVADFVEVCIEFGRAEKARNLIMRMVLDSDVPQPKLEAIIDKYGEAFGSEKRQALGELGRTSITKSQTSDALSGKARETV